jgi:hypothetical protein
MNMRTWAAVWFMALAPSVIILALSGAFHSMKGGGAYFGIVGPFLIALAILYSVIGYTGVRLGKFIRALFRSNGSQISQHTDVNQPCFPIDYQRQFRQHSLLIFKGSS